jgi:Tfp pilus assembly protein PilO
MSQSPPSTRRAPRSWLITALLASLAVAHVTFVFVPAQADISKLRGRLNERRQHILQAQGLALPVEQMAKHVTKTRQVSDQWRSAAPSLNELSETFAELTSQAKAAGVSLERLDPQAPTEMKVLSQHAVTVQFRGGFAELFDFLGRVEKLPGTVWITNVRVSGGESAAATLQGELNLTIFVDRTGSAD